MAENEQSNKSSAMVNIGGLWLNRKQGTNEIYFSGYLNGAKLLIFKNNFKKEDKHPDYIMWVTTPERRDAPTADEFEEEIPF